MCLSSTKCSWQYTNTAPFFLLHNGSEFHLTVPLRVQFHSKAKLLLLQVVFLDFGELFAQDYTLKASRLLQMLLLIIMCRGFLTP